MINDGKLSPTEELRRRLANNKLEDDYDYLNYWQYAARLAALGDNSFFQNETVPLSAEMLQKRCRRGICEVMELDGEELALSIIDAQDFYCFERRKGNSFPEVKPYFAESRDVCEHASLDDDAADLLRGFIAVFDIPEEECLPVVNTPISNTEYALLHHIYRDVELPVIEVVLRPRYIRPAIESGLYNDSTQTFVRATAMLAASGGITWGDLQPYAEGIVSIDRKKTGFDERYVTDKATVFRQLTKDGELNIFIHDDRDRSIPIDGVRIKSIPAFQDEMDARLWKCSLKSFDTDFCNELIQAPITIQLANGVKLVCVTPLE